MGTLLRGDAQQLDRQGCAPPRMSKLQLYYFSHWVGGMLAEDYGALVAQGREAVLRTLALHGMTDIANNLQHELVIDPPAWERAHGLRHGAAFGMSHGLDQLALFRPPLADPQVATW